MAANEFDCKEGCGEKVEYERQVVRGIRSFDDDAETKIKTKTVYLTCAKGHTHPYKVQG